MKEAVLITGGAGYVGSHVSLELHETGYPIMVLDNLSRGGDAIIAKGATFIENDAQCREPTSKAGPRPRNRTSLFATPMPKCAKQ